MKINEILRETRKKHGFSQKQLAEKIGTNPVVISSWECGKKIPTQESIDKIASALKMDSRERFKFKKDLGYKFSAEEVVSFTKGILLDIVVGKPADILEYPFNHSNSPFESEEQKSKVMAIDKLVVLDSLTRIDKSQNDSDTEALFRLISSYINADERIRNLMVGVCKVIGNCQ